MGRARNRRGEGDRLRADILTAATGLLDRGGERAVTLRAVARAAGITPPSIYPHFPDRPAILLAVARQSFAALTRRLTAAAAATEDPRQRLYAAGNAYLAFAAAHPRRYRAMFDAASDHNLLVPLLLAGALTDCAAAGHSTSTDPTADAVALWVGLHGMAHQRAVMHTIPWSPDLVPHLMAALAHLT